ncbi:MAG TPA: class I SAM-dependent methyltransferase [Bryobacteraceae bacterium]
MNKAVQSLAGAIAHKLGSRRANAEETIHPFDLAYHVDTSGLIWGEDLPSPHSNTVWSTAYYGIAPSIFHQVIEKFEIRAAPDWSSFTFVDLGCGKGRALMLASRWPFRAIVGIEISPELVQITQRNLATFSAPWQQCYVLEVREGDAASVALPSTPLVVYINNPFAAPALELFLTNLERSLQSESREAWILYFTPMADKVFTRHPTFEPQFATEIAMQEEDALADRFHSRREAVVVYRYAPRSSVESGRAAGNP